jgi:hypothetical protein
VGASGINYILHVVGRTRSQSRTFYYRTFLSPQLANGYWTPWRKVDLDIKADIAMPAIFNGRLYLFWPSVQSRQKSDPMPESSDVTGKDAAKVRAEYEAEISLSWSQYVPAQNKWLKTCVSKSKAKDTNAPMPFNQEIGQDQASSTPYHLRVDAVSEDALSLLLVKTKTESSSDIAQQKLGTFQILASGHDTFNADSGVPPLLLGYNMPESTILKSNAAEEDGYDANTALKFEQTAPIFNRDPETFRVYDTNLGYFGPAENKPFFYETPTKSLFGQIKELRVQGGLSPDQQTLIVQFQACNHPVLNQVVNLYQNYGPPGIMNRLTQALPKSDNYYYDYYDAHSSYYYNYYGSLYLGYYIAGDQMAWGNTQRKFEIEYNPGSASVVTPYALPTVEFGYGTPYGVYNWELFFHAPVLIADRLSQDMQFEDAMHWYHFVFDPKLDLNSYEKTRRWAFDLADGSRYWNFLPFFANKDATESLAVTLGFKKGFTVWEKEELNNLIDAWRRDPFNPHLIARQRMVAYQKNVVMKYLDNLIAWGDQLFRQDTFEAINEATQLYILAAQLIGKRPENIEPLIREPRYTYRELDAQGIDHFAEAIADVEYMMVSNKPYVAGLNPDAPTASAEHFQRLSLQTFFFVIPRNPKLDTYWDTVADRLFKIRNSMNIDGVKRQLALFEPPIEPGLLVRAAAAGLDLSSVLSQLNAPLPLYRFNVWLQRAVDLCNELKSFGAALLAALEKKDAEHLQLLRQDHEVRMLQLVRQVKQLQLDEANAQVDALNLSRKLAEERHDYYSSREKISGQEQTQLTLTEVTTVLDVAQGVAHALTGISGPIPDMEAGMVGPFPAFLTQIKVGSALGTIATAAASLLGATASATRGLASIAGMNAGYDRRWDDWKLQERLALDEMAQIDQQIVAAEIRVQIAQQELDNQDTQIDQAQEIQTFLEDKFTSEDLYKWMITQLSSTFRQIYNLAYDAAKTAERSFQFELGIADTNYVQSNYMDNLKQGLLTGEKLIFDLKRMDLAYLEKNKREFEIQKPISLATINGSALQDLREKGSCDFDLPEILFDLDYPGQYFRRIRGVRLTIPCVTGPHTNVSAKLSLTSSAIRVDPTVGSDYGYGGYDDTRFAHDVTGIQSIATGSAQNDPGLFELNFKDERYLPFEGAGVISHWHLELPTAARQFDYNSISDVVIHLSYTSRDAGGMLATQAASDIQTKLNNILSAVAAKTPQGLVRAFSLSKEFPDVFHQLLSQGSASMTLLPEHFPYILRSARLKMALVQGNLVDVRVLLSSHATATLSADIGLVVGTSPPTLPTPTRTMAFDDNGIALTSIDMKKSDLLWNGTQWTQATWSLAQVGLLEDAIEDIVLEVSYLASPIT